jgi:hypothetical protein
MEIINRVKKIITTPKTEWAVIATENTPSTKLCTEYVLLLALIPAIATFIGHWLVGYSAFGLKIHSIEWGIRQAVIQFISMVGGIYLTAFIVNILAENFGGAKKDFDKAFALVAYSYTPIFIGGVFLLLPSLSLLASLMGIYGLYLLYIGLQPVMKCPDEKATGYFIVTLIATIVVSVVLALVLASLLIGNSHAALLQNIEY